MTQKAAAQWMAFPMVMKRVSIMNAHLKGPPSQRKKKWPRFKAIKDLVTPVFSINAQQRTTSRHPQLVLQLSVQFLVYHLYCSQSLPSHSPANAHATR